MWQNIKHTTKYTTKFNIIVRVYVIFIRYNLFYFTYNHYNEIMKEMCKCIIFLVKMSSYHFYTQIKKKIYR